MKPVIATLLFLLGGVSLLAQSHYLDSSFGNGGELHVAATRAVECKCDNKMRIICASVKKLTRYNQDGSLDKTFGIGGVVACDYSHLAISILPNNKILALSSTKKDGKNFSFITKYNEDGTLDGSFGVNGIVTEEGWSSIDYPVIRIFSNGQILISSMYSKTDGFAIFKYNADGTPDNSFGKEGRVAWSDIGVSTPYERSCCVLSDNSIVLGGFVDPYVNWKFAVVKLNPDGSLAKGFGDNGVLVIDFVLSQPVDEMEPVMNYDSCRFLKELENGQFIAGGLADNGDTFILKINADGTLDGTFGEHGIVPIRCSCTDIDVDFINNQIIVGNIQMELSDKEFGWYYPFARFDMSGNLISREYVDLPRSIFLQHEFIQPNGKWLLKDLFDGTLVMLTADYILIEYAVADNLTTYPNPFDKAICVEYSGEELKSLALYDQSGRRVLRKEVEGFNVCIEPNLPPGTYALVIETASGKKYSKKIVRL